MTVTEHKPKCFRFPSKEASLIPKRYADYWQLWACDATEEDIKQHQDFAEKKISALLRSYEVAKPDEHIEFERFCKPGPGNNSDILYIGAITKNKYIVPEKYVEVRH